jgi:acetyltransferase-like isoleucine patch superfamily enzyme
MSSEALNSRVMMVGNTQVMMGRFSYGLERVSIMQCGEGASLTIGSFCSIASATVFLGCNHRVDWITTYPFGHIYTDTLGCTGITGHPVSSGDIVIGNDVWLGTNSTIMSGITIGDGAVIAANSHVVKDVEPYSIVGGNPAKFISYRFTSKIRALLLELKWWELPLEFIQSIAAELSGVPDVEKLKALVKRAKAHSRHQN